MKIAVVLSGYFGTISTNDMKSGIKSHKKITNFFKDYDVDYYIHSWQIWDKNEIVDLYNPKKSMFESQIDFDVTEKEICDNQIILYQSDLYSLLPHFFRFATFILYKLFFKNIIYTLHELKNIF